MPVSFCIHGHDDDPGSFPVQPVNNAGIRVFGARPAFQAIAMFRRFPGNAKEPALFCEDQYIAICMQDGEPGI